MDSIVRYLQPPSSAARGAVSAGSGPERYYADRGEEPGRWLGRTAWTLGLTGAVQRGDFAAVLAGRDPHTDERLITAQGSAGRRATLGSGTHTRVGADGEHLYGVADAAAALGVSRSEVDRMLDVGTALAVAGIVTDLRPNRSQVGPSDHLRDLPFDLPFDLPPRVLLRPDLPLDLPLAPAGLTPTDSAAATSQPAPTWLRSSRGMVLGGCGRASWNVAPEHAIPGSNPTTSGHSDPRTTSSRWRKPRAWSG